MAGLNIQKAIEKKIIIRNLTDQTLPIARSKIKNLVLKILKNLTLTDKTRLSIQKLNLPALSKEHWAIGIVFLSNKEIGKLNKKYLKHNRPTDVIAFNYSGIYPINDFGSENLKFVPSQGRRATTYSPKDSMPSEPDAGAGQNLSLQPKRSYGVDSKINCDLAISLEMAKKNAEIYKTSFKKELVLYIIHGFLHVFGYNDDTLKNKNRMFKKQEEIFKLVASVL